MATSRLTILERELLERRTDLIRAILELPESGPRNECAARLADLVRAEQAIAREYGRDGWLRAAALYGKNPITALVDFDRVSA